MYNEIDINHKKAGGAYEIFHELVKYNAAPYNKNNQDHSLLAVAR